MEVLHQNLLDKTKWILKSQFYNVRKEQKLRMNAKQPSEKNKSKNRKQYKLFLNKYI